MKFSNFPLPHLLRNLKLDKDDLTHDQLNTKDEITACFSKETIDRSEGAEWNEERRNFCAVNEAQDEEEEADESFLEME